VSSMLNVIVPALNWSPMSRRPRLTVMLSIPVVTSAKFVVPSST
jgi:hypothetical protein